MYHVMCLNKGVSHPTKHEVNQPQKVATADWAESDLRWAAADSPAVCCHSDSSESGLWSQQWRGLGVGKHRGLQISSELYRCLCKNYRIELSVPGKRETPICYCGNCQQDWQRSVLPFGWFPGVWIFVPTFRNILWVPYSECSETSAQNFRRRGIR
jgi:hypothetical protein